MGRNASFTQLMSLTGHKKIVPLMTPVYKRVTRCRQAQTFGRTRTDETSPVPYGTERFIYTADVPDGT
jgi:hypothetical protein